MKSVLERFKKKEVTFHFLFWRLLLDLGHSDLFTLVGNSFVGRKLNIKNQITVGKNFSGATKLEQLRFSTIFSLEVTAFPRYTMVVVGFGTFRPFLFGWL